MDSNESFSPEQKEVWRAYVTDMPADWFTPKAWPNLANLCGLVTTSQLLRRELAKFAGGTSADVKGFTSTGRFRKCTRARCWQ